MVEGCRLKNLLKLKRSFVFDLRIEKKNYFNILDFKVFEQEYDSLFFISKDYFCV